MNFSMSGTASRSVAVEKPLSTDTKHIAGNRIFFTAIILTVLGFLFVIDTSFVFKGEFNSRLMLIKIVKVIGFIIVGWLSAFYLSKLHIRSLRTFGGALMFASLLMLMLVFTPLGEERNGCLRWIKIGPLTFQPLEFFKVALVLRLAEFLAAKGNLGKLSPKQLVKPALPVLIGLILLAAQPNISAVVFISLLCLLIAWVGGLRTRYLIYMGTAFVVFFILQLVIHPDRVDRIISIWRIQENMTGSGYQVAMALFAIARGGIFGVGLGNSIGKFALPYNDSDFIFTIVVEEFGLIGGILLAALFVSLVYSIIQLARSQKENYQMLVCFGLGIMIAAQASINIAVNLGFLPTTGMPLPFISAGGSNLVATLIAIGILLNLSGNTNPSVEQQMPLRARR